MPLIKDRLESKLPSLQEAYIAVAGDAEAALDALGKARLRAQAIVDEVASTGSRADIEALANSLGMRFFDAAVVQSAGSKGLLPLFAGGPERYAQVGVRVETNVATIIKERLGVEARSLEERKRPSEEGRIWESREEEETPSIKDEPKGPATKRENRKT